MDLHNYCVLETDDQLTIVNRSTEHRISKKLLHKIPYFGSMLSHDVLESKENRVELDFDEKTFKIILDWIELDFMYIDMDHVINLCTMADYFGMNDDLLKDCFNYFHKKFSFEFLPTIIPQVTSTSKLVNSSVLDAFICRHFLKIVQTTRWSLFPFETIDYICKLDLMIYSEYQVFDAIIKWVDYLADYRKSHLKALLNSVRWCLMKYQHLTKVKENELIKSEGFEPHFCYLDNAVCCCCYRTKQEYFIAIEELEGTELRIKVLDSNFLPLVNQVVQLDASMLMNVLHDEHISDIPFDSGRRLIRLDWKQNKYRLLDYKAYVSHHFEVARCTRKIYVKTEYQGTKNYNSSCQRIYGSSLLEANGKFILFRIVDGPVSCWSDPKTEDINPKLFGYENNFISTILDKNIYIMTKNFDFMTFKMDQEGELKIIPLKKIAEQLSFDDLILTSSQVKNEVFLVDKSTKNIFKFSHFHKVWVLMGLLVNYNSKKTVGQKAPSKFLTFTTAFLSIDAIRPCLKRKLASMN
ncbi:uncharacterized protein LOC107370912 [Tetranychus urticae]|uniref:BACK domain-containing protein n=1 Tax=Tetranychus urticae TaxID=32264 RepID=T1JY81_TETUR|nr:uncharacterized protein LOC107370912 [Tetranychus urticae]